MTLFSLALITAICWNISFHCFRGIYIDYKNNNQSAGMTE